jgi:hypothetical protein
MFRKFLCFLALIFFTVPLLAEDQSASPVDKKVGYALLESIAKTFHDLAVGGSKIETIKQIERFLVSSMADARKAKEMKQIDPVFFARYSRLLAMIKLFMAPDPGGILVPIIDQELKRFINEVLGEDYKGSGPAAIGQAARAIAEEIINLHLHLDNVEAKAKLWKSFEEKYGAKPEKKND